MSNNVDARFLGHWQVSQRRQQAMRKYLALSALGVASFDAKTLDLIADAFPIPPAEQHGRSTMARTASLMSDDR